MFYKKEIMMRLCEAENNIEWIFDKLESLQDRVKKLEPKKGKKNEANK